MRGFVTDSSAPGGLRLADDLPEPEPARDELVVEVRALGINRGELSLLEQRPEGWRPGQDLAGVVDRPAAGGSGPKAGARVVGVGQFAVQLAVAAGARVTAQVSGPEREEEARSLGAHDVAVSLDDDALGPFDLVLDGVGGPVLRYAVHRLVPGGTAVLYGMSGGAAELVLTDFASAPLARVLGFFVHAGPEEELASDLATLATLVAEGRLDPKLGLVRDWEEIADVLDALRGRRVRGKAVLTRD